MLDSIKQKRAEKKLQKSKTKTYYTKINSKLGSGVSATKQAVTQPSLFKLSSSQAQHSRRKDLNELLIQQKLSAKATGQPLKRTGTKAQIEITQPKPFNLSANKRQKLADADESAGKQVYIPLKIQVDQAFNQKLRGEEEFSEGKQSQPAKLTVPCNPLLISGERSKLHKEVMSTEDKIFHEIQNRGAFKARPLSRKLFENRETSAH